MCSTGIGCLIGAPLGLFSADQAIAGGASTVTGNYERSTTERILSLFMSEDRARELTEIGSGGVVAYGSSQGPYPPRRSSTGPKSTGVIPRSEPAVPPDIVYRNPRSAPLPGSSNNPRAAKTPGEHVLGGEHLPGSPFESWTSDQAVLRRFMGSARLPTISLDLRTVAPSRIAADLRTAAGRAAAAARETAEVYKNMLLYYKDSEVILKREP